MELEGVVYRVLPAVKGTSARGEWSKQEVIFEMPGEFNRKVCVSFWGDKVQDVAAMREGDRMEVSVNLESREYNGRWYTEVRAWKITRQNQEGATPAAAAPSAAFVPPLPTTDSFESAAEETDDLPF